MKRLNSGFTLIKLTIVVAIIGILAAIAIPQYQNYVARAQVSEALVLASGAKMAVAEYFNTNRTFPADNAEAGLSDAADISDSYVESVTVSVDDGKAVITSKKDPLPDYEKHSVFECDKEVSVFLSTFSDQEFHKKVSEAKFDLKMWIAASLIINDQKFTREEQEKFEEIFDFETLKKFKVFLSTSDQSNLEKDIIKKIENCREQLRNLVSSDLEQIETSIKKEMISSFSSNSN